ncbi:Predicted nucleotide-binding protein, sugar kinase/HSP70/actin superfamily [Sporolituus thermophilus DSM 23256]|uniref:Predicted nucleotide-binding protein, sugar kinase/HSP70/actin superfamily n=2 Tax=Sporolituus TaxID=909931 RepID=A0A1G7L948_9FIRM|nr:Predicted nucleotide-binding protein, sugar kinase/HSP70/actin superfamily [Sporolituus thermophilus DSM 23256]
MAMRIGIPRALLYYQYGSLWERFLSELGAEVIVTGETTKATLDYGSALDEVCLPVKVYFGHVYELCRQGVDVLFTPRLVSVAAGQYTCPKIIGMPDLLRSNLPNLPPLIDFSVSLRRGVHSLYQAITGVGRLLGKGSLPTLAAWYRAWRHTRLNVPAATLPAAARRVGLIAHPYLIHDRQISMRVVERLQRLGVTVVTAETVTSCRAAAAAKTLGKKIFWSSSAHMAGAALSLMHEAPPVDGIIFMSSFACGPDALIGELISQRAYHRGVPCMLLTLDEHTAEAGFVTRLEAFTDMLLRRNQS